MTLREWRIARQRAELLRLRKQQRWLEDLERRKRFKQRKEAAQELNAQLTGRWFCQKCKIWHPTPARGPQRFSKQFTAAEAINQIELRLAQAPNCNEYRYRFLTQLAADINEWSATHEWGLTVRAHFLARRPLPGCVLSPEHELWTYIHDPQRDDWPIYSAVRDEAAPLTEEQKKLVRDHFPLVLSIARKYAPNSPAFRDDLVTHLLETLIGLWPQYDKTLGVTFGAFAKPRLMGAARDCLKHRPRTISMEPAQIDIARRDKTRKLQPQSSEKHRRKHWSGGDKRLEQLTDGKSALWQRDREGHVSSYWDRGELNNLTARYLASGGEVRRKTPTLTEDLQRAIAKLNARQQAIYRGRVLTDPPVTRDRLARQLGIRDSTQISRILRQAERKVAKILKPKVSP